MRDLTLEELASLAADLKSLNESRGFEAHPFKIGWYNQSVAEKFELPHSSETLAFVIISQPSMFEKTFLPFVETSLRSQVRPGFSSSTLLTFSFEPTVLKNVPCQLTQKTFLEKKIALDVLLRAFPGFYKHNLGPGDK